MVLIILPLPFQIELDAILALNPDLIPTQPTENVRTLPSKLPAPVSKDSFFFSCPVPHFTAEIVPYM